MMTIPLSTCLTVEHFFAQANWHGLQIKPSSLPQRLETVVIDNTQIPKLSLLVEDFFALNNWRGLKQTTTRVIGTEVGSVNNNSNIVPPLTLTVGEFFQHIVWRGKTQLKIASMPEIKPIEVVKKPPESLNLNDLSSLF